MLRFFSFRLMFFWILFLLTSGSKRQAYSTIQQKWAMKNTPPPKEKQKNKAEVIWFSLRRKNKDFFSHTSKEKFNFICCYNNQMIPTCSFLNWEWLHFKVNACLKKTKNPVFFFYLCCFICFHVQSSSLSFTQCVRWAAVDDCRSLISKKVNT